MADRCPDDHTPEPQGYVQWHSWAQRMSKTHKQRRCSGCGLYKIWEPKKQRAPKVLPPATPTDPE